MTTYETVLQSLEQLGWAVSDGLAPAGLAPRLYDECRALWEAGRFRPAEVGRGPRQARQDAIRGDAIHWLEPDSAGPASREFLVWITQLRTMLNQAFFMGLNTEEFHFARYPAGAGYTRHLDQHQGATARKVSVTLYLSPDWPVDGGGELRLYEEKAVSGPVATVLPTQGRMVLFLSDQVPHDVQPGTQPRWSLTGWLRTAAGLPL
ncbi:MAG TPA: 2OG-Fe(II) oxygenase [Burkholderiaceae bacterium]|nr:2OG-Fe(II) oxygenase [Burkholderiaceae bacterium]